MDVKKSIRPIIENIIAQYLPWAVGVLVFILAWLSRQLELWQILALALVLCAVIFWLINQVAIWKDRHRKGLAILSDKELGNCIYEWIRIPQWSTQPLNNLGTFDCKLEHENLSVLIIRNKRDPKVIDLIGGFQTKLLKQKLQSQWDSVVSQLKIELCRLCMQWEFAEGKDTSALQIFNYVIIDNDLTEYQFRAKVMSVINATILANELIRNALEQAKTVQLNSNKGNPPPQ